MGQATPDTHQHGRQIGTDSLHLSVAAHHGLPYLVARRCLVFLDHDEQRTIPARHAIGLFVAENQIFKDVVLVSAVVLGIREQLGVVLAASVGRRAYVQL